ncbi:hypothetical protein Gotri_014717 [Gossypium trilobum]|uniref:Uncharacterized protein n=1 Tax=Gossypium trilobum TaxID=34281 RepID=A0A7J9DXP7_9ROSI|nr:hypothetical protein [Gossypium trilobum]
MLGASEYYSLGRGSTINYYTPQALQQLRRFYSAIKKESPRGRTRSRVMGSRLPPGLAQFSRRGLVLVDLRRSGLWHPSE